MKRFNILVQHDDQCYVKHLFKIIMNFQATCVLFCLVSSTLYHCNFVCYCVCR